MRSEFVTKKGAAFLLGVPLSRLAYYTNAGLLNLCNNRSNYYKVRDIEAFAVKGKRRCN